MRCEGGDPHFGAINARDFNLAVGEFEKAREVGLNGGRRNAFGKKNDPAAGSFDGDCEREVVTERVLPDLGHVHLLEEIAANGRAAAPAEVFRVTTKHGDHGSIPGGEKGVGESIVVGNEPAHGGGGADAGVGERGDNGGGTEKRGRGGRVRGRRRSHWLPCQSRKRPAAIWRTARNSKRVSTQGEHNKRKG